MNLILLEEGELAGGEAILRDRRAAHLREVLRARAGDAFEVGVVGGGIGGCTVVAITDVEVRLRVALTRPAPAPLGIDLVLALPRPKVLRRLLATVATLGVKRIVLANAARVEKSYFDSPLCAPGALRRALLLGLEQAKDTVVPEVLVRPRLKPFVEDEVGALFPGAARLVAHPTARRGIEACEVGRASPGAVVAIGPEGGFVPFELDLLERAGFAPFRLCGRVLKVEAAVVAALAQVELARRRRPG